MAVDPRGRVLAEAPRARPACLRVALELAQVSDWYLGQARRDIVAVRGPRADGAGP